MENNTHKGTELKNVMETWDQNERNLQNSNAPGAEARKAEEVAPTNDLERLIKQEAEEYDNENKENRILSGDRATVNDDVSDNDTDNDQ
jgi:hypothetical protein